MDILTLKKIDTHVRYFIRLSYRGANYHGWQSQPNAITVQQAIEQALSTVLRAPIAITGAGRTDTGVNAAMMIAHFDYHEMLPTAYMQRITRSLNGLLGRDIAIQAIFPVHDDAHARFDATSRTYKYFTHGEKSPFLYPLSWQYPPQTDFDLMNEAAATLPHYTDFTSFSKLHTDVKTNNCAITAASWQREGEQMVFTITANRFLRNMVRAIVGTLVEVGRGRRDPESIPDLIASGDRCVAGQSVPGHALFLTEVHYPENIYIYQ